MKKVFAAIVCATILAAICAPASATMIRFDDLTTLPDAEIVDGYVEFNWDNFSVLDATHFPSNPSGYLNGLISGDYVALNDWGEPAEFSGDPFHFVGAYLTSAWRDGLSVEIEGYRSGILVYSETVVLDTSGPLWFHADYFNVDTVRFIASGGTHHAGYAGDGTHFVMDDLTLAAIPAPGAVLLVGLGTVLAGWLQRRRMV